jgi:hypothetical protein
MARNGITRDEIKVLILKQKHKLSTEYYYGGDPKAVANKHLNELLDKLDEFRY